MSAFQGTTNLATLVGAFLSDTYFGRYKTLGFASIASFLVLTFHEFLRIKLTFYKKKKTEC